MNYIGPDWLSPCSLRHYFEARTAESRRRSRDVAPDGHGVRAGQGHVDPALRRESEPALPRHDELRPGDERGGQFCHHGSRAGGGDQLPRHGKRLWLESGGGVDGADRGALVRPGRGTARESRSGDEGLRPHGRVAESVALVCPTHQASLRGKSAATSD